ncbi:hypothetical protein EII17_11520 [Clostridiales bacterium COT073_COT-073]|nr:hypothetical protein EII17_11520 [Clostridiales bacterium COT073_COT-073]
MMIGKPKDETYYEEYKASILQVMAEEKLEIPIFYNVNFGHSVPIGIIPMGTEVELNCEEKRIILTECPTIE